MDAIDPQIHEIAISERSLSPLVVLRPPRRGQACDRGWGESRRIVAQQHRERILKIPAREAVQIEQRQHGTHLGGPAQIGRQDLTGELLSDALNDPLIIDPGCLDPDGPRAHRHPTGPRLAIANDQRMASLSTGASMARAIRLYLDLQRGHDHAAGTLSCEVVQRGSNFLTRLRSFVRSDYRHHWRAFPRPASRIVGCLIHPERYATFSPTFHNFRL